jgi:hypothetical protein
MTQAVNLMSNVDKPNQGIVLAEPFPGAVTQGVVLVLVIINTQLYVVELTMLTEITTIDIMY